MKIRQDPGAAKQQQLAKLIFSAHDFTSIQTLRRFLDRNPELWLTLSIPVRASVEKVIYETDQIECLVHGASNFAFRY